MMYSIISIISIITAQARARFLNFLKASSAVLAITLVAGCGMFRKPPPSDLAGNNVQPLSNAQSLALLNQYKILLAQRISQTNLGQTSFGRPQPMLRSVVVVVFKVDPQGRLLTSSVYRSNGDQVAEHVALASLQHANPLPPPPAALIGRSNAIEVVEDWLFNNDGHFQLRSIAAPQYSLK